MGLFDTKTGVFDRLEVAVARDRAGDAGGPELHVAAGALLERLAADDVGDREPSTWLKPSRSLSENIARHPNDSRIRDSAGRCHALVGDNLARNRHTAGARHSSGTTWHAIVTPPVPGTRGALK